MRAGDGTGHRGHAFPQHCWVTTGRGRFPGLLLEWMRDGERAPWKGRAIWAEPLVVHQAVLDARQLEPFEPPALTGGRQAGAP